LFEIWYFKFNTFIAIHQFFSYLIFVELTLNIMNKNLSNTQYVHRIDHNNNLNFMRYVLALGVLIEHYNYLCGTEIPWVISSYHSVGAFFAISGFVLIGKLLKGYPFKDYAINRAWRVFPSYFFIVFFVAIFFCFVSSLPTKEYFTSGGFWKYLFANLSFLNFLHPNLPGFETGSVSNAVNSSLWTMKIEIQLSLLAPFVVLICRKYRINIVKLIIFILIASISYRFLFGYLYNIYNKPIFEILGRQFVGQLFYFVTGILIYCHYDNVVKYRIYIIALSIFIYVLTWYIDIPYYDLWLQPIVITILVISLSLIPFKFSKYINRKHNISYELYLCHYPVIILAKHFELQSILGTPMAFCIALSSSIILALFIYLSVGRLYIKRKLTSR